MDTWSEIVITSIYYIKQLVLDKMITPYMGRGSCDWILTILGLLEPLSEIGLRSLQNATNFKFPQPKSEVITPDTSADPPPTLKSADFWKLPNKNKSTCPV
ncbi:hypothetical protein C2G38_2163417 [Gigaspora rosea]|uniref:Uncharacterized protein n=1 Tax=Gigaspora rosea TaxID=44941 RepID=A0A397VXE4_9GLOM|nr:hypothetical protein C2G38_2163417 [Gigaspora rosea]